MAEIGWHGLEWDEPGRNWLEYAGIGLNMLKYAFICQIFNLFYLSFSPLNYPQEMGTGLLRTCYLTVP